MGARSKVIAERTDHPGEFKMYLMGIVNSTFVARRATDHVELVDLSLEKKAAQERYNKEHKALTNVPPRSASPRHHALEIQPADLSMEPLVPLFLASSVSSDCGDALIGNVKETSENMVGKTVKAEKTEKNLESRKLEVDQGLPRGDKQKVMKQAGHTTKTEGKIRVTPKLGRMLSDSGVSTRVQRHPLEVIPEQEHSDEYTVRAKIDRPARVLQHPLERIDEDSPKERKPTVRKERKPVVLTKPQPGGRKLVRESKIDVKQTPKRERAKPRDSRAPITKPRKPKPEAKDREKLSLGSPVMEKMEGLASPEPVWNQKFQNLPTLDVSSEPLMEERELRYSSPKMTESDVQDELSFRVWERESIPKRKSVSVSSDFQDLDLGTLGHSTANPKVESIVKQIPEQLSPLLTFRVTTTLEPVNVQPCEDESIQHGYPSPSSFICELSPTSLFSDDDNIFSRFQPFPEFGDATTTCKSPRSVLSDEISHFASDSSETGHRHHASSSTYNDDSSDLESPAAGTNERSFSMFTYSDKEVELTTSEDELRDHTNTNGVDELRYFQEANHREPWLEKDGGVLDDKDLEFLLPPETAPIPNDDSSKISEESHPGTSLENPKNPKSQNNWVPCDDTTNRLLRRHSRSSSKEKLHPPKRSVKFAPELVQESSIATPTPNPNPNPKSIRLPRLESLNPKDEDENIFPSVKSWEVEEETATSTISPRRKRWLRSSHSQAPESPKCEVDEGETAEPSVISSRRRWRRCREATGDRTSVVVPCAGRLFSWPQRLAFKVSRSRRGDVSDDESVEGTESFGRSALRDAQQVRRILKGSQKRFSNLTVADILKDNFQS